MNVYPQINGWLVWMSNKNEQKTNEWKRSSRAREEWGFRGIQKNPNSKKKGGINIQPSSKLNWSFFSMWYGWGEPAAMEGALERQRLGGGGDGGVVVSRYYFCCLYRSHSSLSGVFWKPLLSSPLLDQPQVERNHSINHLLPFPP